MQSVVALIVILWDVRSDAVNGKGTVLDTVGVAANYGSVIGVISFGILEVSRAVVIAKDHVLRIAVFVIDKELGKTCTISYEGSIDAGSRDGVLLEGI